MNRDEIDRAVEYARRMEKELAFPDGTYLLARAVNHLHALTTAPLPEELREIEVALSMMTVAPWHAGVDEDSEDEHDVYATQDPARGEIASFDEIDDARAVATLRNHSPRILAGVRAQAAEIVALREALEAAASTMVAESMAGLTVLGGEP